MMTAHTALRLPPALFAAALLPAMAFAQTASPAAPQTPAAQATQTTSPTATQPPLQTPAALPDAPSTIAHDVAPATPTGPDAVIDTSMGRLTCKLFDQEAPRTVANFIGLATGTKTWTDPRTHEKVTGKPFYNGTTFHRVIPGFMIQGGDRLGTGEGDAGFFIDDEISPALRFDVPGRMAMANAGPNTNGTQFFITETPQPSLDGHYSIFGQCDTHSVILVSSIARVERDENDKPLTPVVIEKITIVPDGAPMPPLPATAAPPSN